MLVNVPLEYYEASLTLSSADILAGNTTPITIVANPGSGLRIEVVEASAAVTFLTAAYATNTVMQLINTGADVAQLENTSALISTVSKIVNFVPATAATAGQTQILSNTALLIKVKTGNPITGAGSIKVNVLYRIVTV
jgi:hypothetical protein